MVRPWGERTPHWLPVLGGRRLPVLGGRRIPVWAAVVPASLGALAAMAVTAPMFRGRMPASAGGQESPHSTAALVMKACYAPLLLWGPLVAVATVAYARRRRRMS